MYQYQLGDTVKLSPKLSRSRYGIIVDRYHGFLGERYKVKVVKGIIDEHQSWAGVEEITIVKKLTLWQRCKRFVNRRELRDLSFNLILNVWAMVHWYQLGLGSVTEATIYYLIIALQVISFSFVIKKKYIDELI